jgi:hypothetical protein
MKRIFLCLSILACTLSGFGQRYSDSTWIIGNGHIGKVCINMEESKIKAIFPPAQIQSSTKSSEGDEYSVINISFPDESKPALQLETMCMDVCLVSRMEAYSPKYKTVKGIGVGSTIGELKQAHVISSAVGGEKGIMIYTEDFDQTAFVINVPKLKATPGQPVDKKTLPDDAKIQWIYMY